MICYFQINFQINFKIQFSLFLGWVLNLSSVLSCFILFLHCFSSVSEAHDTGEDECFGAGRFV